MSPGEVVLFSKFYRFYYIFLQIKFVLISSSSINSSRYYGLVQSLCVLSNFLFLPLRRAIKMRITNKDNQ